VGAGSQDRGGGSVRPVSTRRPYGSGSLSIRTDGRGRESYYGRWRIAGKQTQRRLGAVRAPGTRAGLTVSQAEAELRRQMDETTSVRSVGDRLAITEAAAEYIADARRRGRKRSTLSNIESEVRVHLAPFLGKKSMQAVTRTDVRDLLAALEQKGLAAKSIRNVVATMGALYKFAMHPDRRWAAQNPTEGVALPAAAGGHDVRYLTPAEIRTLLDHIPAGIYRDSDRAMFAAAAWTGLRQGELRALRWEDVDLSARRVRVRRSVVLGEVDAPKSARAVRSVPLTVELAKALEELRGRSRFAADGALVFGHPQSGEVQPRANIGRRFASALEAAGLPPRRFHDLRHSYGTAMAAAGVPMRTLQELMGHRDHATTLIYADYSPNPHEAAMAEAAFSLPDAQAVARA
jgi:integrase